MTVSRDTAAARALASVRLEGLEPGPEVVDLLQGWAEGTVTDDDLEQAKRRLAAGHVLANGAARPNP